MRWGGSLLALVLIASFAGGARCAAPKASKKGVETVAQRTGVPYAGREDAMQFADALAEDGGISRKWARAAVAKARLLPTVARLMQPAPAGVPKNWRVYRSRFIDDVRIAAGVRFWQDNAAALERAQAAFGVPAEIVVGLIGVETIYGRNTGNFRVLDALATLAFDFPASHPRAADRTRYFRGELTEFLKAQFRAGSDPLLPLGSYAGATGLPQFMPTSVARFAVDFDGDGRIDLGGSAADAIGSVASYLQQYGWRSGLATHYAVEFDPSRVDMEGLLAPDILPSFSAAAFAARGAVLPAGSDDAAAPFALVELQNGDAAPQYVAGTENFYAITRYNHSSYYAMAVIELGQAVKAALPR